MVQSDTYKPHTYEEMVGLVPEAVVFALESRRDTGYAGGTVPPRGCTRTLRPRRTDVGGRYCRKIYVLSKGQVKNG
jgi:hypothetical protein